MAVAKNATPAQIAPAWPLAQKPWKVFIPGTTKINRFTKNNQAAFIVLPNDELQEVVVCIAPIKLTGERYPENIMKITRR